MFRYEIVKMLFEKLSSLNELWIEVDKCVDRDIAETLQFPEILLQPIDDEIPDEFDAHASMRSLPIP